MCDSFGRLAYRRVTHSRLLFAPKFYPPWRLQTHHTKSLINLRSSAFISGSILSRGGAGMGVGSDALLCQTEEREPQMNPDERRLNEVTETIIGCASMSRMASVAWVAGEARAAPSAANNPALNERARVRHTCGDYAAPWAAAKSVWEHPCHAADIAATALTSRQCRRRLP
jgi:hypothetical protein